MVTRKQARPRVKAGPFPVMVRELGHSGDLTSPKTPLAFTAE